MNKEKIKELTVTVTYNVGLQGLDIPENILSQLVDVYENKGGMIKGDCHMNPDLASWLPHNVEERHAFEWEYQIDELNVEE